MPVRDGIAAAICRTMRELAANDLERVTGGQILPGPLPGEQEWFSWRNVRHGLGSLRRIYQRMQEQSLGIIREF